MSSTRGQAAVNFFIAWALEHGDDIAIPIHDARPWDVLINFKGREACTIHELTCWHRVQVKRIYTKDKHPTVNLMRRKGHYEANDADYLAAVDMDRHLIYLIPWQDYDGEKYLYEYSRKRITDDLGIYCYEL